MGAAAYANRKRDDADGGGRQRCRRRRLTPPDGVAAVDPLSIEVGYALVSLVDEKQGGTLLSRVRVDPQADRHRDRPRRAAGAHRRQPAARAADLRDPGQGRRGGARRALRRIACWRSIPARPRARSRARATREPAFGLPATWIADRAARSRRRRRLHRRRSDDGAVDAPVGDHPHLPAGSADAASRPRRWSTASRRRRRSWSRSWCRRSLSLGEIQRVLRQLLRERVPVRDLTTILEAVADIAAVDQGPRRDHRGRARVARAGDLPAVSDRPRRAAGDRVLARARGAAAGVDRADRSGRRAGARPARKRRASPRESPARSRQAVAQPVLLCTPALRPHLWRLFARVLPHIGVLSHNEVPPHVRVTPVTVLE